NRMLTRSYLNLVVVVFASVAAGLASAEIKVFFTPGLEVKPAILRELEAADKSLDIAMYSLSEPSLFEALIAAAVRGVRTRMILHDARAHTEKVRRLEAAGIDVRYVTPTMHHKFALIDGPGSLSSAAGNIAGMFE